MAAAYWDIVIEEGSEFDLYITLYDNAQTRKNVHGWGALFQVRAERSESSPVIYERSSEDTIYVQPEPEEEIGLVHVKMFVHIVNEPAHPFDVAYWDLLMWPSDGTPSGKAKRIVEGKVKWSPAVSRPSEE